MSISKQNLIRKAFNIGDHVIIRQATHIASSSKPVPAAQPPLNIPQGTVPDAELYRSKIGTPVFADVQFTWKAYTDNSGILKPAGTITFDCVLLSITRPNKIIKTEIQGRDNTVKEYIGKDDFQIQMNGVITSSNGVYPEQEIKALHEFLDVSTEIEVVSKHLQNLGIHFVVIDTPELPQTEGSYSYQAFSVSLISDVPQELRISIR
jgi:hypothetical protein